MISQKNNCNTNMIFNALESNKLEYRSATFQAVIIHLFLSPLDPLISCGVKRSAASYRNKEKRSLLRAE